MGIHGTAQASGEAAGADIRLRAMRVLRAACVVGGLAQSLTGAAGSLLAFDVTGSESAAGLPQTALVAGAAASAAVSSRLAVSLGRRRTLSAGAGTALAGSVVVALGALAASLAFILAGSVLLGAGTATVMLGRYAAAELVGESMRPRAMASVLTATTVGAIAGPNLLAPAGRAAEHFGLPALSGPFVFGAAAFAVAGVVLAAGLRDRPPVVVEARANRSATATVDSAVPGLTVLTLSNLVMVAVMTMAPVQMEHAGGTLAGIGLVVSVHIAGMFAPSPVSAWLVVRIGARRTAALAGSVTASACLLAAVGTGSSGALAAAMAVLGAGWNLGLVAGSSLLTAGLSREVRLRREGLGEVGMGAAAAVGGLACGPVTAFGGYATLAAGGAIAAALMTAMFLRRRD